MNDDRLTQYRTNPVSTEKALALAKKDQEFKSDIEVLNARQERLDGKYKELGKELNRKTDEERNRDPEAYHELRKEYDRTGVAAEKNRELLQKKESQYEEFKRENKGLGQEATQQDVNKTYDEQTFGQQGAQAGLTANRYTNLPDSREQPNQAGDASPGNKPNNDMGEDTTPAPISEEVEQKAQAAAAPIKDQVATDQGETAGATRASNSSTFSEISNAPAAQSATSPPNQTMGQEQTPTASSGNSATMSEVSSKPATKETPPPARDQDKDR